MKPELKDTIPIEPRSTKSILEMAHGAILERVDYEMAKILDNILDANTEATAKRKMTLTLTFAPDGERATVAVSATAKTTLAPTNPAVTSLYLTEREGKAQAVEMVPQIPGQTSLDREEQAMPSALKVIRFP